ncbi:uncharacterized protein EDB91DRAFT_1151267 [Suillus paluster]|uniref:uncharacterized protein n=1 Tax=Suillus paluster TaxID=48578 RepID=UPI001B884020|nr:uncharacterized protein EDB91DRAFT_1151267 [Suillus paluster]KAG1732648.1 hypothetical protein EDB91DRAFT_1151267 [Suillus paluster]
MVLEYSAFLEHDNELEFIKSAVDYYMKSTTAVAVEKVATEISDRGFKTVPEEHKKVPQKWKKIFKWTRKLTPEAQVAPETQVVTEIQVATEITDRGYEKEELKEKILEFILQNRMCTSLASLNLELEVYQQCSKGLDRKPEEVDRDNRAKFPAFDASVVYDIEHTFNC